MISPFPRYSIQSIGNSVRIEAQTAADNQEWDFLLDREFPQISLGQAELS